MRTGHPNGSLPSKLKDFLYILYATVDTLLSIRKFCMAVFNVDCASYIHAEWSAQDDAQTQNAAVTAMLSEGNSANFVTFTLGTTLAEGQTSGGGAGEHMTSFDCAYRIEAVRDWLFEQAKA